MKNRPQTRVALSDPGRDDFMAYLQALEAVLLDAAQKAAPKESKPVPVISLFGSPITEV